jgi:hypothetical protein
MNFQQWVNGANGRGIDEDGAFGNQCWDLWSNFAQQVLGVPQSATSTHAGGPGTHHPGYACEIWHQFSSSPLPAWFTTVPPSSGALPGDVAIWEWGTGVGPSSHVAIVILDQGGAIQTLTQNPGVSNVRSFTKSGLLGYLRPKNRAPFGGAATPAPLSSLGDHIAAEGRDWTYWVPSTQDQATVQAGLTIAGYPVAVDGNLTSDESVRAIKLLCGKFGFFDLRFHDGVMNKNLCHCILLMAQAHGGYTGRMDFQIDGHVWAAFDGAIRATAPKPEPVKPEPVKAPAKTPVKAKPVEPTPEPQKEPPVELHVKPVVETPETENKTPIATEPQPMTAEESAKQEAQIASLPAADLGAIIKSSKNRMIAYSIFALVSMIVTNAAVAYAALETPFPGWLIVSVSVIGNLSVPFAALAISNAKSANAVAS